MIRSRSKQKTPKKKTKKARARRSAAKRARRAPTRSRTRPARRKAARSKPRPRRSAPARKRRGPARKVTGAKARKTRARRPAVRPKLVVVRPARPAKPAAPRRRKPRPAAGVSFPQRAGASSKQLVVFELIRARASLLAAIHGLSPGAASQPMGAGKWSVREVVLHVVTRDQARLRESESTQRGQAASWKELPDEEANRMNEELLAPIRHQDWEEALRLLHRTREQLMEEVESVPEEPAELWSAEHPFGWMLQALPPHDRHHADIIKRWRSERGV